MIRNCEKIRLFVVERDLCDKADQLRIVRRSCNHNEIGKWWIEPFGAINFRVDGPMIELIDCLALDADKTVAAVHHHIHTILRLPIASV